MTQDYRQIPAISNSDLTEFRNYIFGRPNFKPQAAFYFGNTVHELILEPHKIESCPPTEIDMELAQHLCQRVRNDRFCSWVLRFASKE